MAVTVALLMGIVGVVVLLYWWRRRYAIQLSVRQGTSDAGSTAPQNIQPVSYLPNESVDDVAVEPPPCTTLKETPIISLSKAAVSFAVENAAEASMCSDCKLNSTFPGSCPPSPFPHYGLPLKSTAQLSPSQTGRLIPQNESILSPLKVSRLSLDSAWSDGSGTESVLRQVAEQLKPLRSPQLLHSLKQQSTHSTFVSPPSHGHSIQAHKPAQH